MDVIDLSSFSGKLLADKTEGEMNARIYGTPGDQVKESNQSGAETNSGTDGNPENIRVEWLAALTEAEEVLKIKDGYSYRVPGTIAVINIQKVANMANRDLITTLAIFM
jgi:hypothetical protein